jgi:predicted transcriptional regulator
LIETEWTNTRKRRDRLHIMAEVLVVARDGALKTQIMYKANLSFAQLREYLSLLLELGLLKIEKTDQKTIYKTTRKGIEYLKSYDEIRGLLEKEEKNVKRNSLIYLTKSTW